MKDIIFARIIKADADKITKYVSSVGDYNLPHSLKVMGKDRIVVPGKMIEANVIELLESGLVPEVYEMEMKDNKVISSISTVIKFPITGKDTYQESYTIADGGIDVLINNVNYRKNELLTKEEYNILRGKVPIHIGLPKKNDKGIIDIEDGGSVKIRFKHICDLTVGTEDKNDTKKDILKNIKDYYSIVGDGFYRYDAGDYRKSLELLGKPFKGDIPFTYPLGLPSNRIILNSTSDEEVKEYLKENPDLMYVYMTMNTTIDRDFYSIKQGDLLQFVVGRKGNRLNRTTYVVDVFNGYDQRIYRQESNLFAVKKEEILKREG